MACNKKITRSTGLIVVHLGCGHFGSNSQTTLKKLCADACKAGRGLLKEGKPAADVLVHVLSILENSSVTNAGVGSNLTREGLVECDASIMETHPPQFGAVGALSGIQNPIKVAKALVDQQNLGLLPGNLVPPCFVVGPGAKQWALDHGFEEIPPESLISAQAHKKFLSYSKMLEAIDYTKEPPMDTIGAICLDSQGRIASGVSSGGIALKSCGRIGQAAVMGAGCWAESQDSGAVAVSTTGCGECLTKTLLAKEVAGAIQSGEGMLGLSRALNAKFLDSMLTRSCPNKLCGLIALWYSPTQGLCEVAWGHTAQMLMVGYQHSSSSQPKVVVSSLPGQHLEGSSPLVQVISLR